MDDSKKMLKAIINGQSSMKSELLSKIDKLQKEVTTGFIDVNKNIDKVEKNLSFRVDKIGLQVASLEDDAPTIEEFDNLTKRVERVEKTQQSFSVI